jgi:hypothetical protein
MVKLLDRIKAFLKGKEKTKICIDCEQELPLTTFHRDAKRPDGRRNQCKACRKAAKSCKVITVVVPEHEGLYCPPETEQLHHCAKCGEDLPASAFNKFSKRKSGLQGYCRKCASKANEVYHKNSRKAKAPAPKPKESNINDTTKRIIQRLYNTGQFTDLDLSQRFGLSVDEVNVILGRATP